MRFRIRLSAAMLALVMMVSSIQIPDGISYAAEMADSSIESGQNVSVLTAEDTEDTEGGAETSTDEGAIINDESLTGNDNPADGDEQAEDNNPADGDEQAKDNNPADGDEQAKDNNPADGDSQAGDDNPADDGSQVGDGNPEVETENPKESVETEESTEHKSEAEEQESVYADGTGSQEQVVKAELVGAYQFGDAPSEHGGVSAFSAELTDEADTAELEAYLYQQMKERKKTIDVQKYGISAAEIGSIVTGVLNENPDLYFVGKDFECSHDGTNAIAVMLTYDDSYFDDSFQNAVKAALSVVKPGMSELEKAIVLHDYLAVNCEYDKENYDQEVAGTGKIPAASYTAYGALVQRISVCQGYALAYKYLLKQAGIDCLMVTSEEMNHVWNLIKLDGKYHHVDVTWDDPAWDRTGRVLHEYMFRSDYAFQDDCTQKHYNCVTVF